MNASQYTVPEQLVAFAHKKEDGVLFAKILPSDTEGKALRLEFNQGVTFNIPVKKHPAPNGGEFIFSADGKGIEMKIEELSKAPPVKKSGRSSTYERMSRL